VTVDGKKVPLVYAQPTGYGGSGVAFEIANYSQFEAQNLNKVTQVRVSGVEIGEKVGTYQYQVMLFEAETPDQPYVAHSTLSGQRLAMEENADEVEEEEQEEEPTVVVPVAERAFYFASQLRDEEGLGNLLVETLATQLKVKVKYSDAYVALAQRISEIRKEKDPEDARMQAYVAKRVGELVTGRSCSQGAESPATAQPKFYYHEFKQLVPSGGKVTLGQIAETLVEKCMENPAMRTYLLKYPAVRNAALGFAGKTVVRDGKTYYGLYVTLVIAPPAAS
jgi:hypothetical protein